MADLVRRQKAVQATLNKYRGKDLDWENNITCIHALRFHLKRMGKKVPRIPKITSFQEAKSQLNKHGWKNVGDLLDGIGLKRIPHSQMLLGDVAVLDSEEGLGGVVISAGGKVIGWHEDSPEMVVMEPLKIAGAWRV